MKRRKTYNKFRDFFGKYYIDLYKNDILEYYKKGIFCDISSRVKELDGANYDDWINSLKEIFEKDFSHWIQLIPDGLYSYDDENKDEINKLYDTILNKANIGIRILFDTTSLENYTDEQKEIMRQIAVYVVNEGAFSLPELNSFDTDLWRRGITGFGNDPKALSSEIQQLSRFILKVA